MVQDTFILPFSFRTAGEVRFGRGSADAAVGEIADMGRRIVIVRSASVAWADGLAQALDARGVHTSIIVASGEPDIAAVDAGRDRVRQDAIDCVVAVGGGSAIDLGKAVSALAPAQGDVLDYLEGVGGGAPLPADPLPFVAIPSTAGTGAEVTKNAVIAVPEARRKVSLRDPRMFPKLAVVDPALTDACVRTVTLASGLDAITQVVEPYLSSRANPMTDALCAHAIPIGLRALAKLTFTECARARDELAFVSLAGGMALANAGLGAVHGLAGVIGGRGGAPHGLICGRLLGPVLRANRNALREAGEDDARAVQIVDWIAQAFDATPDQVLSNWPEILDGLGVQPLRPWLADPDERVAIVREAKNASSMRANPVVLSEASLVEILEAA